ncbi:type IV toxin-antitoxin system AbiEi family antitoxin domain-containing protein [Micrococcales bacterium 31B]|nr:type IV toxin-antitoxin system AbiEi family antitoxin domain-containing protein [Micrococcales bacterium 31B]
MNTAQALKTLEELGSSQWGLVTTGQAERYGVSRVALGRLREKGMVNIVRRGVYSLPSTTEGPHHGLYAAWLSTEPRLLAEDRQRTHVVVSHMSAASVHGLGDLVAGACDFTMSRRRQTTHSDLRFYKASLAAEDVEYVDGLPLTSVTRTVADLAENATDFDHLADVVRDALGKPEVHPETLADRLDDVAHHYGHTNGTELVDACLESAGLPTVAANLLGSEALARSLEAIQNRVLAAFTASLDQSALKSFIERTVRSAVQDALGVQHLPGIRVENYVWKGTSTTWAHELAAALPKVPVGFQTKHMEFFRDVSSMARTSPHVNEPIN